MSGFKLLVNKWSFVSLFAITPSGDIFVFSVELLILNKDVLNPPSMAACPWLIVRIILITKDNSLYRKTQKSLT